MSVSSTLLQKYKDLYKQSTQHPLTNELCLGTLPDSILLTYLVQDLKYFKIGLNMFAKTLSVCDHLPSMITLGKQIGFICNDEHDYFERCINELKQSSDVRQSVPNMVVSNPKPLPQVGKYIEFVEYLVHDSQSYPELITALYVMEQVYLEWAQLNLDQHKVPQDLAYKYQQWIDLHSGTDFTIWTQFLKSEVDRVGDTDLVKCEEAFKKTLELEVSFFDACYNYRE